LTGKSSQSAVSKWMTSLSVSLSGSGTVHVSGTGPDVYPLSSLQSVRCVAVGGILASDTSKTTHLAIEVCDDDLEHLFLSRDEVMNTVHVLAVMYT